MGGSLTRPTCDPTMIKIPSSQLKCGDIFTNSNIPNISLWMVTNVRVGEKQVMCVCVRGNKYVHPGEATWKQLHPQFSVWLHASVPCADELATELPPLPDPSPLQPSGQPPVDSETNPLTGLL